MSYPAPPITRAGCLLGARLTLPVLPGVIAFAAAFGTVAVQKQLSLAETVFMSFIVLAGASQMVALELWREPIGLPLAAAIWGVVGAVNLRLVLMGAALRPWLGTVPAGRIYPALFVLTDSNWVIALRHHAEGGRDWGVLVGSGLTLWVVWTAATLPGYLFGALVDDPKRWALDLVMPAFFVTMLVPLWRGPVRSAPWLVSAAVASATWALVPGYWFIVTGALAGSLTGALAPVEGEVR